MTATQRICLVSLWLGIGINSASLAAQPSAQPGTVVLTGHDLSVDDVARVARQMAIVRLDEAAAARVRRSYEVLLLAAKQGLPIYGLNRGVGIDRDKPVFRAGELDPEVRQASEGFNRNLLHAHSAGVGPEAPQANVRAAMLARLNAMLVGATGVRPAVVQAYVDFLNRRIHPVLPSRGSIGAADIDILAHVGLAMMGEGEVIVDGQRVAAREALQRAGLQPLVPVAKDGLSILSSNAYAAGAAALVAVDARRLLDQSETILALGLEGLNGNVSPLLEPVQRLRPYPEQAAAARRIRDALAGSYLWQPDPARPLQDPLSFRTASQSYGSARAALEAFTRDLQIQLNSSDDNPAVLLDLVPPAGASPVVQSYYVHEGSLSGAIMPSANFDPTAWTVDLEALAIALRHVSSGSVQRMTRLGTTSMTGLTTFLAPDDTAMAFAEAQYPYLALDAENRALSQPVSADASTAAGGIEDVASNAPLVVDRVARMVDNLYYVVGMELMHAAQAVDLRRRTRPSLTLGQGTGRLFGAYRGIVTFLERDRVLTDDIRNSHDFLLGSDAVTRNPQP
jgi:histidine ammonia-lyase